MNNMNFVYPKDAQTIPEDKTNHFFLGRISRRVSTKGFYELFIGLGLDHNVIVTKHCTSSEQVMLLLLIEWSRKADSSYQQLADALREQQQYTLDFEEVR